jgi:hypothetical protein
VQNNPINNVDGNGHAQASDDKGDIGVIGLGDDFDSAGGFGQWAAAPQEPNPAARCILCRLGDWFRNTFGGENSEPPEDDARWRFHPTSPGAESFLFEASANAHPLVQAAKSTVPDEADIDIDSGIPGISVSASTDPESSVNLPGIKDVTNLKKWSNPKASVTFKWNPPAKNENLGEVHASYGIVSGGTNVTPDGPKGLNIGIGAKAELPVGGSVSEEGVKGLWDQIKEGAGALLPKLFLFM